MGSVNCWVAWCLIFESRMVQKKQCSIQRAGTGSSWGLNLLRPNFFTFIPSTAGYYCLFSKGTKLGYAWHFRELGSRIRERYLYIYGTLTTCDILFHTHFLIIPKHNHLLFYKSQLGSSDVNQVWMVLAGLAHVSVISSWGQLVLTRLECPWLCWNHLTVFLMISGPPAGLAWVCSHGSGGSPRKKKKTCALPSHWPKQIIYPHSGVGVGGYFYRGYIRRHEQMETMKALDLPQ